MQRIWPDKLARDERPIISRVSNDHVISNAKFALQTQYVDIVSKFWGKGVLVFIV